MPELPEVETIVSVLNKLIKGRTILAARLLRDRLAPSTSSSEFDKLLKNKKIHCIHRRGKFILFDLNDKTLLVHLRMSGRFSLLSSTDKNPKFTHAIFYLDSGERLVFDDQRHFGLMKIVKTNELQHVKELNRLGPEPFSVEFTPDYLHRVLNASKRSVKEILIDQTKLCGLGNIYAAEAMFAAGLHPAKPGRSVSRASASKLYESILTVLTRAISHTDIQKIDPRNIEGGYFNADENSEWFVYNREGEPCRKCQTLISRIKQGGRSTCYCHRCQCA